MPAKKKEVEVKETAPVKTKSVKSVVPRSEKSGFEYKRLSASMYKTFLQCKRKFYKNYIEGIPDLANTTFSLGNACHYALEKANLDLIKNLHEFTEEEVEKYIQDFRDHLVRSHVPPQLKLVTDSKDDCLFESGAEMVRQELQTLDYSVKVIAAEVNFDIVTPEGVRIYGFIDKVEEIDEDTIKILDYKTSNTPLTYDEARTDVQLSLYELAGAILYPQYSKRLVALKYLRTGKELVTTRSAIAQYNFRKELLATHEAILEFLENYQKTNTVPKGSVHNLCNWCSYRTDCEDFLLQINKKSSEFPSIDNLNDDLFIREYSRASIAAKAIENYQKELKLWALQRVESDPTSPIQNDEFQANSLSTTRRTYDPTVLAQVIPPEDFVKLVTIKNESLDKYLNTLDDEELKTFISQQAEVKFNSPQFRLKKVR